MTASASASLAREFGFTICRRFASRANGMWVCPQTTPSSTDSGSDASQSR